MADPMALGRILLGMRGASEESTLERIGREAERFAAAKASGSITVVHHFESGRATKVEVQAKTVERLT